MKLVASDLLSSRFFVGHKLYAGLRGSATDADWSSRRGHGGQRVNRRSRPRYERRAAGLDELHGEGMALVRQRAEDVGHEWF